MSSMDQTVQVSPPPGLSSRSADIARVFAFAIMCVFLAEIIGNVAVPLWGSSKVVLLPLLWALLLGITWGLSEKILPQPIRVFRQLQELSAQMLQPALLLFIAKLGLLVGGNLPKIMDAGWALVFQELGHFCGTILFGLPIAIMLGIKRESIGATFSVGREPSLAIIGEKFGMDSPEGRGVLAEYMTGTVFGAVFIAIFAGFVTSLGLFDPRALAMGAGVGSGSMMAAASGAIAAQQTPEVAKDVATFAAASNLVTTTIGTYFTLFLSLPLAVWVYGRLEPILGRISQSRTMPEVGCQSMVTETKSPSADFSVLTIFVIWVVAGLMSLIGNRITYHTAVDFDVLAGVAIIIAPVVIGQMLYVLTRKVIPAVIWVSLTAMLLTFPATPYAAEIAALTGKINFMALVTPMLAFAGLSIAKDMPIFRRLGWRIVVVSLAANAGTFIGATLIAQFFIGSPH